MTESVAEALNKKKCRLCGGPGPFNKRSANADGLDSRCRACSKRYCDDWRKANPEATREHTIRSNRRKLEKNPEKYKDLNRKYSYAWHLAHPEVRLHTAARQRAKAANLPFNIERSDVVIPACCPLLEVPLQVHTGRVYPNSPTLDRIIPALGYVKGNVWVVSHKANVMKNDATLEELELLVRNLRAAQGIRNVEVSPCMTPPSDRRSSSSTERPPRSRRK